MGAKGQEKSNKMVNKLKNNFFPTVIGQAEVKQILHKILVSNRLGHAYLLSGREGSGRTALALELARIVNCEKDINLSVTGCDCQSCKMIYRWHHPNLYPIFPLPPADKNKGEAARKALKDILDSKATDPYAKFVIGGTGRILVDQIRELRNRLSLIQDRSGIRTVIVQPAERMNEQASNALLKLLEEPPEHCCILLLSESIRNLLPTIVSRCQILPFVPLTANVIEMTLVSRNGITSQQAKAAALLSEGNYTHALTLAMDGSETKLEMSIEFLRAVAMQDSGKLNSIVEILSDQKEKSEIMYSLRFIEVWLKDAMVWQLFSEDDTNKPQISIVGQEKVIKRLASRYSWKSLELALYEVEQTRLILDTNANVQIALIALGLKIQRILG
jgi:DNA polymerase III subunit delta'